MPTNRFEQLAVDLAERDRGLVGQLSRVTMLLEELRVCAEEAVATFCAAARARDAGHLTHVRVGPVEPDEKHVDCMQLKVRRGRWEIVCVGKPEGRVIFVGPYQAGKPERPCLERPLPSEEARASLEELLLALLGEASGR